MSRRDSDQVYTRAMTFQFGFFKSSNVCVNSRNSSTYVQVGSSSSLESEPNLIIWNFVVVNTYNNKEVKIR